MLTRIPRHHQHNVSVVEKGLECIRDSSGLSAWCPDILTCCDDSSAVCASRHTCSLKTVSVCAPLTLPAIPSASQALASNLPDPFNTTQHNVGYAGICSMPGRCAVLDCDKDTGDSRREGFGLWFATWTTASPAAYSHVDEHGLLEKRYYFYNVERSLSRPLECSPGRGWIFDQRSTIITEKILGRSGLRMWRPNHLPYEQETNTSVRRSLVGRKRLLRRIQALRWNYERCSAGSIRFGTG